MKARIAVLAGDGIGPEVIAEARARASRPSRSRFGHEFDADRSSLSAASAIDLHGDPLPRGDAARPASQPMRCCSGAIGGPKWSAPQAKVRPEAGLLRLRKELGVYANLRPVQRAPGAARRLDAQAGGHRRRRPDVRARTDRRHLLRRQDAATPRRPPTCAPTPSPEIERIVRVAAAAGAHAAPAAALDRQVQRARDLAPVARGVRARGAATNSPTCSSSTCWSIPPPCT